jgi:hypothetical protein
VQSSCSGWTSFQFTGGRKSPSLRITIFAERPSESSGIKDRSSYLRARKGVGAGISQVI